jgi:nucleotide-binding universal stress UspA family protein
MTRLDDRDDARTAPLRVLVAVHGHEAEGWGPETARVLARWDDAVVRVLAVLPVPHAPFTSLTPGARRAYDAARAGWAHAEFPRVRAALDTLVPRLSRRVTVDSVPAIRGDTARTVVEHARVWNADVVVIGAPPPGFRSWLQPGPVHERVLRRVHCAVLVTARPSRTATPAARVTRLPRAVAALRRV